MAVCTPQELTTDSRCLVQGMNERQLLAAILCVLATQNDMACDAQTLVASSKCLWAAMSERQLLASIALTLCEGGGGGGGGLSGITEAAGLPPTDGSITTLLYRDTNTGFKYVNLGTAPSPIWDSI